MPRKAKGEHQVQHRQTYILFALLDARVNLLHVPLDFIIDAFELIFSQDSKRLAIIQFPLPESLRPCHEEAVMRKDEL